MYRQRPKRNKEGKILYQAYKSKDASHKARVEPNRRWFGPVRTVTQQQLSTFREEIEKQSKQPNSYILRASKVPYSLLRDVKKEKSMNLLEVESFESTFGKKSTRKKPKLVIHSMEGLAKSVEEKSEKYDPSLDKSIPNDDEFKDKPKSVYFQKGQSHRIWNELYKVIDSSDVVIQVLDARDPLGTRSARVEKHIKKNCPHKHLVLVLNKVDLIPTWATKKWLKIFSKEYPTLAFHASMNHSFGKGSLIQLLRQFQHLHSEKQQISVGFIGYPNVGKSSVINTLREKKVCKVAPIPGETKVWQYITLFRKVFLIDCPGVVTPASNESEEDVVLKGVLRVENLDDPAQYISALFKRTKKEYLENTYGIKDSTDDVDFLEKYALKTGKLLKKGEPDVTAVAKMILNDWIRGRIPYFIPPPEEPIFSTETGKDVSKETQENSSKQKKNPGKLPEIITPKQKNIFHPCPRGVPRYG